MPADIGRAREIRDPDGTEPTATVRRTMSTQSRPHQTQPHDFGDPSSNAAWAIVSYVLSGIIFWGLVGLVLDRWIFDQSTTGTVVFVPIGVVLGAVAGGYLGYMRFLHVTSTST